MIRKVDLHDIHMTEYKNKNNNNNSNSRPLSIRRLTLLKFIYTRKFRGIIFGEINFFSKSIENQNAKRLFSFY